MMERRNTIVRAFESTTPKLSAYEAHEWIFEMLRIPEEVFVRLSATGMGFRRIRVANLPPEEHADVLRTALAPYGTVIDVVEEAWTRAYRYVVGSGVRYVTMTLTKHVPSYLIIQGTRVLLTYDGQPLTCYNCGDVGKRYNACQHRRSMRRDRGADAPTTYASVTSGTMGPTVPHGVEGPDNLQPLTPASTEHVTDTPIKDFCWISDVETVPSVSPAVVPAATDTTIGCTIGALLPAGGGGSDSMEVPRGPQEVRTETVPQWPSRDVDTQTILTGQLCEADQAANSSAGATAVEVGELESGTCKQKMDRNVEETQRLPKRQKKRW
jgi:hypothetical protein